jgi:Mrp family chromosome partitioning ATPase
MKEGVKMPENSSCSSASTCSRESCEGCPSKAKGGSRIAKEPMNKASNVKKVIGVVSGKGGVGKSFVTSSLACAMNKAGYKVGIMDADITGPSIPKMFGVHGQVYGTEDGMVPMAAENGIKIMSVNLLLDNEEDPVIWRGPVIAGVVKQFWNETVWGDIDYLFVDMPPGTGVPVTPGRWHCDRDVSAGISADDREKSLQYGRYDAHSGTWCCGELQLSGMSGLR